MTVKEERELMVLINQRRQQLDYFVKENNLTVDLSTMDMCTDNMVDITVNGKDECGNDMEIYVGIEDGKPVFGLFNLTEGEDESLYSII